MSYVKFVLIGEERIGSNFLQLLLNSHKAIICYGEIFNPNEEIRKGAIRLGRSIYNDENPIEYLEQMVFKNYDKNIQAVGFRLFYSHAKGDNWNILWQYLKENDIKIIHMKRKNLLDRYISLQFAKNTGIWIEYNEEKMNHENDKTIFIDVSDCVQNFYKTEMIQSEVDDYFNNSNKAIIFYEDLCAYPKGEPDRIQKFLETEPHDLNSPTKKQQNKKKREIIQNYDELKQLFIRGVRKGWAKKDWIKYFDDE
jgi:LPS sulfotransferase NodH